MSEPHLTSFVKFTLNGVAVQVAPEPGARLSEVLREELGVKDVKIGCNAGDCGACTVLLDGLPVCACLTSAFQASERSIETLGGLVQYDEIAKKLEQRFQEHGAAQCGICTPGMMVSAVALLRENQTPDEQQIKDALGGVLCRCTGYRKILDAVAGTPSITQMGSTATVGVPIQRVDGYPKTHGTEAFGDDIAPSGTLEILVIRSPFARASFVLGDLDAFVEKTDGLVTALARADIPGKNRFGVIPQFQDQPVFAEHETRFRGEAVAALVGTPEAIKQLRAVELPVEWTELVSITEPHAAQQPGATEIHKGHDSNIMCGGFVACGDADAALAAADLSVSGHFKTGFVEHGYIEPEAGYAYLEADRVVIHACTQAPMMDRESLAIILGCEPSGVRIVPTGIGGGFGSKLDLSVQPFLALAALKIRQPVRLAYSRIESMQSSTKRHPSDIHLTIGASKDGRIMGFKFEGTFDTGAYASWGPTVANRVPVHASGPYRVPDYLARSIGVFTHNPPAGAFRGFGVPQSAIAQESLFDELAAKLGMDALEFRLLNVLTNGEPTVCGQVFEQGVGIKACLESLKPAWHEERLNAQAFNCKNTSMRRGVGIASAWYGCGNTSLPNPSTIKSGISADGKVILHQGAVDLGQGSNTVITQIFAQELGVSIDIVELVSADTDLTPDAGKTSASRQTFISGNAARLSGEALRLQILKRMNCTPDAKLNFKPGFIEALDENGVHQLDLKGLEADAQGYVLSAMGTYDPPIKPLDESGQGSPYAQFGYAAHLVVVEVDIRLGVVKPIKFIAAHDVGHAINPLLVEGQVHGGIAQGLGMALMEEYIPGRTENLHDYLIPTIGDIPPIETIIVEEKDPHGPHGAKGLGEHVLIPTAPAILNAIFNATGARLTQVPATPSRVRAAIEEIEVGH